MPNIPLALFLTANNALWNGQTERGVRRMDFKVADYDGHALDMLYSDVPAAGVCSSARQLRALQSCQPNRHFQVPYALIHLYWYLKASYTGTIRPHTLVAEGPTSRTLVAGSLRPHIIKA